jgi:hypothetical protein
MTRPPVTGWVSVLRHGSRVRVTTSGTSTGVPVSTSIYGRQVRKESMCFAVQGNWIASPLMCSVSITRDMLSIPEWVLPSRRKTLSGFLTGRTCVKSGRPG